MKRLTTKDRGGRVRSSALFPPLPPPLAGQARGGNSSFLLRLCCAVLYCTRKDQPTLALLTPTIAFREGSKQRPIDRSKTTEVVGSISQERIARTRTSIIARLSILPDTCTYGVEPEGYSDEHFITSKPPFYTARSITMTAMVRPELSLCLQHFVNHPLAMIADPRTFNVLRPIRKGTIASCHSK